MANEMNWRFSDMLKIAARSYESGARRSGRTSRLIAALPSGRPITIICATEQAARILEKQIREQRPDVDPRMIISSPEKPNEIGRETRGYADMRFDHNWVCQFYEFKIEEARREIEGAEGGFISMKSGQD